MFCSSILVQFEPSNTNTNRFTAVFKTKRTKKTHIINYFSNLNRFNQSRNDHKTKYEQRGDVEHVRVTRNHTIDIRKNINN